MRHTQDLSGYLNERDDEPDGFPYECFLCGRAFDGVPGEIHPPEPEYIDGPNEPAFECPECVERGDVDPDDLPELSDADREAMNALGDDLVDRLWKEAEGGK